MTSSAGFLAGIALVTASAIAATVHSESVRAPGATLPEEKRIVGYYASWDRYRGFSPAQISGELVSYLIYAFGGISRDGAAVLGDPCADVGACDPGESDRTRRGNFAELLALKQRHPYLKVLVAIGGWNGSANFSNAAATSDSRQRFVASALDLFLNRWPGLFDGFDLDWEYPVSGGLPGNKYRREDRENYTLLAAEFRRQLAQRTAKDARRYLLTIAGPAAPSAIENLELDRIAAHLDWINLMTYDYHGASDRIAHFNAPLFAVPRDPTPHLNVNATVEAYLHGGVLRAKITLGLPFFGYGLAGVPAAENGLLAPVQNGPPDRGARAAGRNSDSWGVGEVAFRELRDADRRGFRRFWQQDAKVPWLFNADSHVWISYDDAESLGAKIDYLRQHDLGGAMIWELGGDDGTLLDIVNRRMKGR